jgi:1,4-alpha-glucan branching enzyme
VVAICNFTPLPRELYRLGLPRGGRWLEVLNTDAQIYGGANIGNGGVIHAEPTPSHGKPFSAALTLPPLGTLILRAE